MTGMPGKEHFRNRASGTGTQSGEAMWTTREILVYLSIRRNYGRVFR